MVKVYQTVTQSPHIFRLKVLMFLSDVQIGLGATDFICYIANVVIKMTPKKIDTDKFMNYLKL